ncbi:hypothetical protein B0F90DRAFT_1918564 [Multifurca ochricompacta]|uniref:Uncharacterized protein n=1 Tax=Multifurca ochricompacta TaxID=376703 RepID=A0AAD4QM39_9AGAM|nr:hypothetical protein B0F90DRAFT_1918564 [Multifurca ochricompacta]
MWTTERNEEDASMGGIDADTSHPSTGIARVIGHLIALLRRPRRKGENGRGGGGEIQSATSISSAYVAEDHPLTGRGTGNKLCKGTGFGRRGPFLITGRTHGRARTLFLCSEQKKPVASWYLPCLARTACQTIVMERTRTQSKSNQIKSKSGDSKTPVSGHEPLLWLRVPLPLPPSTESVTGNIGVKSSISRLLGFCVQWRVSIKPAGQPVTKFIYIGWQ